MRQDDIVVSSKLDPKAFRAGAVFLSLNLHCTRAAQELQFCGKNSVNIFAHSVNIISQIQQK